MRALRSAAPVLAWALLAVLLASGVAWWARAARMPSPQMFTDRPLRVGVNVALDPANEALVNDTLDAIAAAGFTWVRQRFPWDVIEPQPGLFDWTPWDRLIDAIDARGLHLIAVLDGSPAWARPQSPENPLAPPRDPAAFGRFAAAFAARYGDRVDYYQVWDEPNIQPHWSGAVDPVAYVALLREGALAIRQADPDAVVLTAALAPTLEQGPWNLSDVRFLEAMYRAGAAPWFDILAAQPFGFGRSPDEAAALNRLNFARVTLLRAVMERAGDADKPIWAVRFGWHASPRPDLSRSIWGSVRPARQVAWTGAAVQRARVEWPWLGALLWAIWQPSAPPDDPMWGFALVGPDGTPRETLATLSAAAAPTDVIYPGRYDMSYPVLRWEGGWRRAAGAADVGRTGDALTIPFWGTRLDLRVQRGDYWGLFWVEIDGQPANALPRDALGRAYLVLYDPRGRATWVTVARGLPSGKHRARLVAEGGWGQWPLVGFAVGWEVPPARGWRTTLGMLAALVAGAMAYRVGQSAYWASWVRRYQAGSALVQCGVLGGMALAYAALPWPWAAIPLLAIGRLITVTPDPGLTLIALAIPFYYIQKSVGTTWLSHAEALTAAALVWAFLRTGDGRRRWLALDAAVLAFALVGTAAVWVAPDRGAAWLAWRRFILMPGGLYLLWRWLPVDRRTVAWAASGLVVAGVLVSLIGLFGYVQGQGVRADGVLRLRSVYFSPNEAALLLVRLWPLAAALALAARGWRRWLGAGAAGIMLLALGLTFSRGAWLLGVPAGFLALAALHRRRRWWPLAAVIAVGVALVVFVRGGGTALRPAVWQAAWAMWRDHPWLGVGLDGFQWVYPRYMALEAWREPLLYHPHNLILEIGTWMGGLGLLTAVALGWIWVRMWRRAIEKCSSPVLIGLAAGWIAGLAHGLVDAAFFLPHLAFMTMLTLAIPIAYMVDTPSGHARIQRERDDSWRSR